jgi:hypothetical protein
LTTSPDPGQSVKVPAEDSAIFTASRHHTTWSNDRVLDVWVEPDRTVGRKDEDELALAVAQGRYTQAEADDIIAVADAIEHEVAAWAPPFGAGWESFRPDPAWTSPTLDGVARLPGTFTSVRGEY